MSEGFKRGKVTLFSVLPGKRPELYVRHGAQWVLLELSRRETLLAAKALLEAVSTGGGA